MDEGASMPTEPVELIISLFELSLLLAGAFLLFRVLLHPERRARWLAPRPLPPWPVTLLEFAIFVFLIFGSGVFFQILLHLLTKDFTSASTDWVALQLCVNGLGLDGGGLVGWLLFRSMQKTWHADAGAVATEPLPVTPRLPWSKVWLYAGGTLLMALPVVAAVNLGWVYLLRKLGLPDEPQDLIAIFSNTKSPFVVAALLAVACGLAPLYEELLFRAGIYRFCRENDNGVPMLISAPFLAAAISKTMDAWTAFYHKSPVLGLKAFLISIALVALGAVIFYLAKRNTFIRQHRRVFSIILCGFLFGAMHQNLASFVPLSLFGMVLAVAYETTGSIRVAIIAHGLFNLNTVLIVLSGLS